MVIGAIIGVNAKWMYLNEIVGDVKSVYETEPSESRSIKKIGVFA